MSAPNTPFGTGSVDVGVSWSEIKFKAGDRDILKSLSGNALPRRALAIMGSSGAGKTTFLNALSDRLAADGKHTFLSGKRYLNDVEYERKFRNMVGYVTQEDVLDPMSNPEEIFKFSLRVRRGVSQEEAAASVDTMIDELGLEKARQTIVGIPGIITGLSGGERKRTNIGAELITNPKVLYLDEPTSGLDSVTSARVCELINKLARRGRTVVFTIHQPTEECSEFFDDIMLMCSGEVVYHGPFADAVEYFESIGYACPETHTPTDFFMTLLQDPEISEVLITKWGEFLDAKGRDVYQYTAPVAVANDSFTARYLTSYASAASGSLGIEFTELMGRSINAVTRNKLFIGATLMQNVFFAIIIGVLFVNLKDTPTGVSDRMGLLFIVVANLAFSGTMGVLNNFPPKKAVFIREQQSGAYSPFLFFVTMQLAELPIMLVAIFLQAVIVYWIAGLAPSAAGFFNYYAITVGVHQVGIGLGMFIGCAIDSFVVASGVAPLLIIPFMLCAGLLASTDRIRPYWYWLEKPSFLRAGFLLLAQNEFERLDNIWCDPDKFGAQFCARQPQNGDQVLAVNEFDGKHSEVWIQWLVIAALFFIVRAIAIAFLYQTAKRKS